MRGRASTKGAREQAKRAADLDPAYFFPQMAYGWIDIEAGKIRDAIPELQKAKAMESPAFVTAFLGYAYGASGDRARALAEMDDLKRRSLHGHVLPFNLALVYIGLGDRERALDFLEQAYAIRFAVDGVAQERPYLRSAPLRASLCRADEES
jgi:tetratricopeptide (TPR) repeat protein